MRNPCLVVAAALAVGCSGAGGGADGGSGGVGGGGNGGSGGGSGGDGAAGAADASAVLDAAMGDLPPDDGEGDRPGADLPGDSATVAEAGESGPPDADRPPDIRADVMPGDGPRAETSDATGQDTGGGDRGPPKILWTDKIQGCTASPWGFSGLAVEYPIGTAVTPSDGNGANVSCVPNPLAGGGHAIRHYATFDAGGARAQAGIWSFANTVFDQQAKKPEGVWIAQEWYIPVAFSAGGDAWPWMSLWDWHTIDPATSARWHTSPGVLMLKDGSMRVSFQWSSFTGNSGSAPSTIPLPVGRWFDVEMHYTWTTGPTTLSLWIDGQLALEQPVQRTRGASHSVIETYVKFYGSSQGRTPWTPTPSIKYTRNVRIAGERIWR